MLSDSRFTTSIDNPIILEEESRQIKTVLMIIAAHPCSAMDRCDNWTEAKILYGMMQKYQLDRLQPWFSHLAGEWAFRAPFEALCLACNNPCFDENLARCAILNGLEERTPEQLFDPEYFTNDKATEDANNRKLRLLDPFNTTVKFSLDLGFKGYVAYCKAFSARDPKTILWKGTAQLFIETVREFERERETSVCIS
jgi:hypothetical protein